MPRASVERTQAASAWPGGAGESRSSSSDTFIECQTIQAATWVIGRRAMFTMTATSNSPYTSYPIFAPPKNLLYAGRLRELPYANSRALRHHDARADPCAGPVSRFPRMATEAQDAVTMDKIVALCKRRG